MRKSTFLSLLLIFALLLPGLVMAQDTTTTEEVDVLADIVMPRLVEYNAAMADVGYGTLKLDDFMAMLAEDPESVTILDVREVAEVEETGVVEGAINIPLRTLGENLDLLPDLEATIVVICKSGFRATLGMANLQVLGYTNAKVLIGGMGAYLAEEYPVVPEPAMVEAGEVPADIDPLLVEYVAANLANLPEGWGVVTPANLFEEMFETMPDLLMDVRSDAEWADPGYIEGATHIWVNTIMENLDLLPEDLEANIVVYCASGYRGGIGMTMLQLMGYTNVRNLAGGVNGWLAAELPVLKPES
ncbi:MAG: rhodanese-like domain-containing protein [Anaerolineaceae bacterium]|nr:rhodanese-like domain-containing protein [Anaerolineaceae bacterium]